MTGAMLTDLLEGLPHTVASGSLDGCVVSVIAYDSRKALPGSVFVAQRSPLRDGHDFVSDAYDHGCRCFIVDHVPDALADKTDATVIVVPETRNTLAIMSARWFNHPAEHLAVVALTGTKGKTTISFMLKAIFEAAGKKVGIIGSNGVSYGDTHFKMLNTTPESYELHRILAGMVDDHVDVVVLEATSQGFMMHRTDGIHFDVGVFTNISPDHISATEHASFEEYLACKKVIFTQTDVCFVNRDDPLFDQIVDGAPSEVRTFGFQEGVNYRATDIELVLDEHRMAVDFTCVAPGFTDHIEVDQPGVFNASNALAAICVADFLGTPLDAIKHGLKVARVDGRMELVDVPAPYTVLIDFAHNKLSMEALMATAKAYKPRRVLSVFGLEGDRAHIRRFDCGRIIGREMDYTILSDASPRMDDPDQIIADIAEGIREGGGEGKYEVIRDRHISIPKILDMAGPGDLVLIVGKGNVPYEEVRGEIIPLDEHEIIRDYFVRKGLLPA